jgi:single-strand DNA-binding protein
MANLNKIFLIGNLTRDPQLSYLPSQMAVVEFGIAVNRTWVGKDGAKKEDTCFVDCRAFGKPAENINKYLTKGRSVFLEGRLTFDSWTAQDGTKRSKHRVTVESCQFLGGPSGGAGGQGQQGNQHIEEPPPSEDQAGGGDDIPF